MLALVRINNRCSEVAPCIPLDSSPHNRFGPQRAEVLEINLFYANFFIPFVTDATLKKIHHGQPWSSHSNNATSHYTTGEMEAKGRNCLLAPWQLSFVVSRQDAIPSPVRCRCSAQIGAKNGHKYFGSASSHMWSDSLERPPRLNQKWQEEQGRDGTMAKWL